MPTDSDARHATPAAARFVVGLDLCVRSWDAALEQLTGLASETMVGSLVGDRLPAALEGDWFEALQAVLFGGSTDTIEVPKAVLPLTDPNAVCAITISSAGTSATDGAAVVTLRLRADDAAGPAGDEFVAAIRDRMIELGVGDDAEGLELVLGDFLSTAAELSIKLDDAVAASDAESVERIAHRLAGASLTLGVQSLGECFARLERAAARRESDTFPPLNASAQAGLGRAVLACRSLIGAAGGVPGSNA